MIIVRILLGLFFIGSAIAKLFPMELFELKLINDGFVEWGGERILASAIIAFELFIGLSFFSPGSRRKLYYPIALLFMGAMTAVLVRQYYLLGDDSDCGCFGGLLSMTPSQSLLKNAVIIALIVFLFYKDSAQTGKRWLIHGMIALVLIFSGIYLGYPQPVSAPESNGQASDISTFTGISEFSDGKVDLIKGEHLVLFLSAGCDHCKEMAMRLHIADKSLKLPPVHFILWGSDDSVEEFFRVTQARYPYAVFDSREFFKFRVRGVPSAYFIRDGILIKEWNYKTFTVQELQHLFGRLKSP